VRFEDWLTPAMQAIPAEVTATLREMSVPEPPCSVE
jgi:hypothetical protein